MCTYMQLKQEVMELEAKKNDLQRKVDIADSKSLFSNSLVCN